MKDGRNISSVEHDVVSRGHVSTGKLKVASLKESLLEEKKNK